MLDAISGAIARLHSPAKMSSASASTAYGPADNDEWADVLCQYFMQGVLAGASLGTALLEARQRYVQTGPTALGPKRSENARAIYTAGGSERAASGQM